MNPQELKMGDIIDLKITRLPESTFIVGEVVGVRQDYFHKDTVAVLIGGLDLWITLTDEMEVSLIDA